MLRSTRKIISSKPWLVPVLAFLAFVAAWIAFIAFAVKHKPAEVPRVGAPAAALPK